MTHSEDLMNLKNTAIRNHLQEGEEDIRAGRVKDYSAKMLDKMTLEVINENNG